MNTATVKFTSALGSFYQPGRAIADRPDKKDAAEWDAEQWKTRAYWDESGHMMIPGIAFKRSIEEASRYNPKILKRQSTYTALFESSLIVMNDIILPATMDTVEGVSLYLPSDGKRSSARGAKSTRVWRKYPTVKQWSGEITFTIMDDRITEEIFKQAVKDAGMFIGIGTWRPQRGGMNGRFDAKVLSFVKHEEE